LTGTTFIHREPGALRLEQQGIVNLDGKLWQCKALSACWACVTLNELYAPPRVQDRCAHEQSSGSLFVRFTSETGLS